MPVTQKLIESDAHVTKLLSLIAKTDLNARRSIHS
jgi:hypothetical protein